MKPILLEINAFGPYAGCEVVDFRRLGERSLFLICGPTGAGKTTILDAICYALYGKTSGNMRSGAHMRSEYATAAQKTSVTFTFSLGPRRYRVSRSPEQTVLRKDKKGLRQAVAEAELCEVDDDGKELAYHVSKNVTAEAERLLGFDVDQFRQVVLLPQGDFRKLLLASSADRQQIMQTLFHTQQYARLEGKIEERHREIAQRNREENDRRNRILTALEVADEAQLAVVIRENEETLAALKQESEHAERERAEFQQTFNQARQLADLWQSLTQSKAKMAALAAQQETMAERKRHIDRLHGARLLAEPCKHVDELARLGGETRKKLDAAAAALERAEGEGRRLTEEKEALEAKKDAYKARENKITELHRLKEKVAVLHSLRQVWEEKEKRSGAAEKALADVLANKERHSRDLAALRQEGGALREAAASLAKAANDVERMRERVDIEGRLLKSVTEAAAMEKKLAEAQGRKKEAEAKARQDKLDYDAVRQLFLRGQAALLAQTLEEGVPCPVCGAVEHLQPALQPPDLPREDDVEKRRLAAEKSAADYRKWDVVCAQLQTAGEEKRNNLAVQRQLYPADGTLAVWRTRLSEAEQSVKMWEKKEARRRDVEGLTGSAEDALKRCEQMENEARDVMLHCRQEAVAAAAGLQHAVEEVPAAYRAQEQLDRELRQLQRDVDSYQEALRQTAEKALQAERAVATYGAEKRQYAEQVEAYREQYKTAFDELKQQAAAAGFADIGECRLLQAELPCLEEEEKQYTEYLRNVAQIQGQISQHEAAIDSRPQPDMAALNAAGKEKYDRCQQLTAAVATATANKAGLLKNDAELRHIARQQAHLQEQYKTVGALYELIRGDKTGVNFERYVLGALLDEVLMAANARLQLMSRSRYSLQRSRTWDDRRVQKIGLDIAVFDQYTGYVRPANTLSGGETFFASLSLALGLADVVQAYSGGIRLDTMFIDEGFGTLDSETLDFALKVLVQLKQGGRLVGIISHVPELRDRIDTQLIVDKTDRGSTVRFALP